MAKPIVFLALGERIFGSVGLCPKIVANIQNVILMESEAKIKKAFFWRLVQSDEYNVNGVVQVSLWNFEHISIHSTNDYWQEISLSCNVTHCAKYARM